MSFDALAWAGKCKPGTPARKLVLFALADRHNTEEDAARPSVAWMAEWTGLNRKTVISALDELEARQLIGDTGLRAGTTGQIKVYRLHLETVPKTEQSQKRNSPTFSSKGSQKRDTDTVKEPVASEANASSLWHALPANWVPARSLSLNTLSMVENWPPGAFEAELESFRAWAANAEPKKGKGLKKDWDDAFGNWIRSAHRDRYSRVVSLQRNRPNLTALLRASSGDPESGFGTRPALPASGNG